MKNIKSEERNRFRAASLNPTTNGTKLGRAAVKSAWTLALALTLASQAHAATSVSGNIVDQTWTKVNSPYNVSGNLLVAGLTIQPGVRVLFQGNYVMEVAGTLKAIGSSNEPIVITRTGGGWQGIYFNAGNPGSKLVFCVISNSVNSGIRIGDVAVSLEHCRIVNNSAPGSGGGIAAWGTVDFAISDSEIVGNVANGDHGGGLAIWGSGSALVSRCLISSNTISSCGFGGGMACSKTLVMNNCTSVWNVINTSGCYGDSRGGGLRVYGLTMLNNCLFAFNMCNGRFANGGAISTDDPSLSLRNTLIVSNSVYGTDWGRGGGLYISEFTSAHSVAVNCTIAFNNSSGVWCANGSLDVKNSIVWGNDKQFTAVGAVTVSYSDVQSGYGGTSNINQNPIFNPGTLAVLPGSPCIDKGDPATAYNDTCFPPSLGLLRNDMGAYGGPGACAWGTASNAPRAIAQPEPQWGCPGSSAAFAVAATTNAGPLRYQWFRNTSPIVGQRGAALSLTGLAPNAAGPYSVMVSNDYAGFSATAVLSMYEACVDLGLNGTNRSVTISPAGKYVLKCTTNAANANFATWTPLATNTFTGSNWVYLDTNSPSARMMFYGVKRLP